MIERPSYLSELKNYTPIPFIPKRREPMMRPFVVVSPTVKEPYSPERAAWLLATPVLTHLPYFIRQPFIKFFADTLVSGARTVVEIIPSERAHTDRWYGQGNELTCGPWSLINACSVADIELNPGYVARILNLAYKDGCRLESLANSTKTNGVNMKRLLPPLVGESVLMYEPKRSEYLKTNANVIKNRIDQMHPFILCVTTAYFYPRPNAYPLSGSHAICISGYQVTEEGYFNVQVIDSNYGIVWMSLEHLSVVVQTGRTFNISKVVS